MDPSYWMLFDEVRHALEEVRTQRYREAERTLEGVLLVGQFMRLSWRRDPQALRLERLMQRVEWETWTPEGRLERERLWAEWMRSPEWLRDQARLRETAREEAIRER